MRLTAKDVAARTGMSYVVAAGFMAYLEDKGKAVVVEKRFHESGRGKPTRVYEVDQHTMIDFGDAVVPAVAGKVEEVVPVVEVTEAVEAVEATEIVEVAEAVEVVEVAEEKVETLDHVAKALARLREAQADAA
jgi:predicted ArsR family transcriptional regulator